MHIYLSTVPWYGLSGCSELSFGDLFFNWNGAVKIETAFVCRKSHKQTNKNPITFQSYLRCGCLLIPLLGSFYEIFQMLEGWEGGVPLTLDGKSMLW